MIAGGTEAAISPVAIAGFANMKALSTNNEHPEKASCPFDKKREGFVMGEGAGVVVLEELEHAKATWSSYLCRNLRLWYDSGCLSYYSSGSER